MSTRACKECHFAKVKCNRHESIPCRRCERLSLKCVKHVSRQGQGRKERKTKARKESNPSESHDYVRKEEAGSLECVIAKSTRKLGPNHYGIHFLVRSWVSYALTRRSFSLLAKASTLACQCGIDMDQILCGEGPFDAAATGVNGVDRPMTFLPRVVIQPTRNQIVSGDPLLLSDIPSALLQAMNCFHDGATTTPSRAHEHRWIFVREFSCGQSRFYVSQAFSRDFVTWGRIQETWKANQQQVKDLWMTSAEYRSYTQGFIHQISLHNVPGVPPTPTHAPPTKIRLAGRQDTVLENVKWAMCFHFENLDHAFQFIEYFLPFPQPQQQLSSSTAVTAPVAPIGETTSLDTAESGLLDPKFDAFLETIGEFEWNPEKDQLLETLEGQYSPLFVP